MDLANALGRSSVRLEELIVDQAPSPSSAMQRSELLVAISNLMAELPDDYRQVLLLRHLEGLAFGEVALRLNRTTGATRMLWFSRHRPTSRTSGPRRHDMNRQTWCAITSNSKVLANSTDRASDHSDHDDAWMESIASEYADLLEQGMSLSPEAFASRFSGQDIRLIELLKSIRWIQLAARNLDEEQPNHLDDAADLDNVSRAMSHLNCSAISAWYAKSDGVGWELSTKRNNCRCLDAWQSKSCPHPRF